jgi:carboxymethylenebutenolidase
MCHEERPAPVRGGAGIVEEWVEVPGADRDVPAFCARPEGESPVPGVLIVHDIWGANDFYQDLARRLAGEGFAALLPDLFVRQGPLAEQTREAALARRNRLDQALALRDVARAVGWLRDHGATSGRVGTIGFCMGGTLVMLAAARQPVPDASVAFYGFPAGSGPSRSPIDEAAEVRSPLLAFWGDADHGVGMENVEAYRSALAASDARHEFVIYPRRRGERVERWRVWRGSSTAPAG